MKTFENFVSTLCGISRRQKEQNPTSPNIKIVSMKFFLILLSKFLPQFKFLISVFLTHASLFGFTQFPSPASGLQYLYILGYIFFVLMSQNFCSYRFPLFSIIQTLIHIHSSIFSHPSDLPIILSPDNLIFRFHCLATRMFHVKRSTFHSHFSYISIIRCST